MLFGRRCDLATWKIDEIVSVLDMTFVEIMFTDPDLGESNCEGSTRPTGLVGNTNRAGNPLR
jgi:hypothetical protein